MPLQHGSLVGWFIQMVTDVFGTPTHTGIKTQMSSFVLCADVIFHGKTVVVNLKRLPSSRRWSAWSPKHRKPALISTENDPEDALQGLKVKLEHQHVHGSSPTAHQHGPVQQPHGNPAPIKGAVKPWVPPATTARPKQQTLPVISGPKQHEPKQVTETGLTAVMPEMDQDQFRAALKQGGFKEVQFIKPWDGDYPGFEATVVMCDPTTIMLSWHDYGWKATASDYGMIAYATSLDSPASQVLEDLHQQMMQ
jgi:hypothetical protein